MVQQKLDAYTWRLVPEDHAGRLAECGCDVPLVLLDDGDQMAGMPLKKIQEFAGHSSLKQTMDYIRITDDDVDVMRYLNTLSEVTDTSNIVEFKRFA